MEPAFRKSPASVKKREKRLLLLSYYGPVYYVERVLTYIFFLKWQNRKGCIGFKFRQEPIAPGSGSCLRLVPIFPEIAQENLHAGYNYC